MVKKILSKKDKTELVIFDLWQTLADVKRKPILEIFNFLKIGIDFDIFSDKIFKSDVFLRDIEIDKSLSDFLGYFIKDSRKIKAAIKIWKTSAKDSFLYTDSIEILKILSRKKIKMCLLTNIDKYGFENFLYPELFKYFDYIFLSFRENVTKPDSACWFKIMDYFKIKKFRNVVMIGDSYSRDISPAFKLGLKTIFVENNLLLLNSIKEI